MSDLFVTPWTLACQAPLTMGFTRQEYWSGLPFLSPGDVLDPGIKHVSPTLVGGFFTLVPPKKPTSRYQNNGKKEGKGNHTKNEGNGEAQIFFFKSQERICSSSYFKN